MNCKLGDLAIIISDPCFGLDEGKIVEIVATDGIDEDGDYCWICKPTSPLSAQDERGILICNMDKTVIPDAWLKPVSGLPDTEDTTTDTPIKELA